MIRIGQGFDVHAFEEGRPLIIGGIEVQHERRRNSSIHSGSPFLLEMKVMVCSSRPGGRVSLSMSVTKPAVYSRWTSCSIS